jgi:exodeoxyribonuclease VII large subunit
VTALVREAIRADERLRDVWVAGEVGRVTVSAAGHTYFTLKDDRSQLSCVWFRDDRSGSPFEPRPGLQIVVHGRLDVFDVQGIYQLYVSDLQPAGFGELAQRLEALRRRLAAEGLFDPGRKRPLPERPAVVGVVTSPSGAVIHDIRTVLERRWPLAELLISPCQVQGEGAAASIVHALGRIARWNEACRRRGREEEAVAVTIVARGGGSPEDLWPFNDEGVVRAIAGHPVPVVAGVGHEIDVTLADLAADVRAATPSAAASRVVPDRQEVLAGLARLRQRLDGLVGGRLAAARREVDAEGRVLGQFEPGARLTQARERVGYLLDRAREAVRSRVAAARQGRDALAIRLRTAGEGRLQRARAVLGESGRALAALGPQATLERGYALVRRADGLVVRDPHQAPPGTVLRIQVARGRFPARSMESEEG